VVLPPAGRGLSHGVHGDANALAEALRSQAILNALSPPDMLKTLNPHRGKFGGWPLGS